MSNIAVGAGQPLEAFGEVKGEETQRAAERELSIKMQAANEVGQEIAAEEERKYQLKRDENDQIFQRAMQDDSWVLSSYGGCPVALERCIKSSGQKTCRVSLLNQTRLSSLNFRRLEASIVRRIEKLRSSVKNGQKIPSGSVKMANP